MKNWIQLKNVLNSKNKQESDLVHNLYVIMGKVGGYEQLMNLSMPTLNEIFKCVEKEIHEQSKGGMKMR